MWCFMEKLKGLYVSHKKENGEWYVFIKKGNETDIEPITQDRNTYHNLLIKTNLELSKYDGQLLLAGVTDLKQVVEKQVKIADLRRKVEYVKERSILYHQIVMNAEAGLPIDHYWEGKHIEKTKVDNQKKEKLQRGALIRAVAKLANDFNCKKYQTVNREMREKMLKKLKKSFPNLNDNTLRSTLVRTGFTKEKNN